MMMEPISFPPPMVESFASNFIAGRSASLGMMLMTGGIQRLADSIMFRYFRAIPQFFENLPVVLVIESETPPRPMLMYKWIKLMVDILFLIVGMMILAYLHLLNSSRPTRLHDSVLPAAPKAFKVDLSSGNQAAF